MQCDKATSAAKPLLRHVLKRVLLANLLLGADSVLAQDDAVFRFGGADYVAIGTHVVRHLTWSSKLPFDKSHAELAASQQAFIREMGRAVLEAFLRLEPPADSDRSLLAAIRSQ